MELPCESGAFLGVVSERFREGFGEVSGKFRAGFGQVSGRFRGGFGEVSGRFWGGFGKVSGRFREGFGEVSGRFRGGFGEVSGRFREGLHGGFWEVSRKQKHSFVRNLIASGYLIEKHTKKTKKHGCAFAQAMEVESYNQHQILKQTIDRFAQALPGGYAWPV